MENRLNYKEDRVYGWAKSRIGTNRLKGVRVMVGAVQRLIWLHHCTALQD